MSRYIDADKLLKSAVSKFKCVPSVGVFSYRNGEECFDGEDFEELINEAPTADVVEVVRCKDCIHWGGTAFGFICRKFSGIENKICMGADHYCSYGERSENGT